MEHGLDWYKRAPRDFLDGVRSSSLTSKEIAVYTIVLDLIYEGGGHTPNHPKYIAGHFADLGTASVRRIIDRLIIVNKLIVEDGFLTQKRAQNEAKTKAKLSETRAVSGHLGGVLSGFSRKKTNKNNETDKAIALSKTQAEKRREEKKVKDISSDISKKPKKKRASRLAENWTLPPEWIEVATKLGLPPERVGPEAIKMRDWSLSSPNGVKLNWLATWRSWVRRIVEDGPQMQNNNHQNGTMIDFMNEELERIECERQTGDNCSFEADHVGIPQIIHKP